MTADPLKDADAVVARRSASMHGPFDSVSLPDMPVVDGLISPAEQRYLYWLTSQMYCAEGVVVELGSWFGRSAMALGAGLRDAGWDDKLYCFDRFMWRTQFWRDDMIADVRLEDGGDFMPYFLRNVSPIYPGVRATKTTIEDLTWGGEPIELLFLDAPKNFADLSKALLTLGPSLTVGRSLMILQDFSYSPAFPLSLTIAAMAEDVELVHTVEGASTASFVLRAPIPHDEVPRQWEYWRLGDVEIEDRWRRLINQIPGDNRSLVEPALSLYFPSQEKVDRAQQYFRQIEFSPIGEARLKFLMSNPSLAARFRLLVDH